MSWEASAAPTAHEQGADLCIATILPAAVHWRTLSLCDAIYGVGATFSFLPALRKSAGARQMPGSAFLKLNPESPASVEND